MPNRRTFLHQASLLAGSLALAPIAQAATKPANPICFFTKHLQGLSYDDIASLGAEMGVNGVESPIRPKGHIEPEQIEVELPKYVEALKKQGLELTILTSGINEVSQEQRTEAVLRTAAKLGVKRFRMLYYKYDLKKPIWEQVQELRPKIKDLVQLCQEIGIQPLVQNHSGKDYVAAPIWDIYSIMREYTPAQMSFCYDIYHATVEGGSQWPLSAALTADHWGAIYFKDFKWEGRKAEGCPLGEGQVSPDFAKLVKDRGFSGPISLHVEYLKGDPKSADVLKEFRAAHVRDLKVLRDWMA
ncbi:MAG: TIM barrel protein [Verrucomicrobia bacterium]|nr:TIM barrel protein [Verrucomicrobiota bacterium]